MLVQLHARMETGKLFWDWAMETLFGDDEEKIVQMIPLLNLVNKLKCYLNN